MPVLRQFRKRSAAGIGQAEQFGGFVERLAGSIVKRFAEQRIVADARDAHELRVAAGNEQGDERKGRRSRREQRREQVAFKMMDGNDRHAQGGGQPFGKSDADEQGARQSRPLRIGNGGDFVQCPFAFTQHLPQQGNRAPDMVARGQFGHDAAIVLMHADLTVQGVCEQAVMRRIVEGETGFIAGGFDSKNQHGRHCIGILGVRAMGMWRGC